MITTPTNLDYLIPFVRVRLNDLTTPYQYSDTLIRTALVSSISFLAPRWGWRYLTYTSQLHRGNNYVETPAGLIYINPLPNEYDVFRNPAAQFTMSSPPVVEQFDEPLIVLAATILLRRSVIASSTAVFANWSTPDFSYSNVASSKVMLDALEAEQKELDDRLRSFAAPRKRVM